MSFKSAQSYDELDQDYGEAFWELAEAREIDYLDSVEVDKALAVDGEYIALNQAYYQRLAELVIE